VLKLSLQVKRVREEIREKEGEKRSVNVTGK
jgi:hypothetical protein